MATRVVLIGEDRRLYQMCREIMAENGRVFEVVRAEAGGEVPEAEILIWDYQPGLEREWRAGAGKGQWHLLLIGRRELAEVGVEAFAGAAVVLKPVTKPALSAWLSQAGATRTAVGLKQDRDELLGWLMEANLRLQEYDQARTDFLAKMVHDFRAPLMASSGYCGLLLAGEVGPVAEPQREILTRVQTSLKRLARMATAMFELSISPRVRKTPKAERADIREPIEQALHEIRPLAANRNIGVSVALTPPTRDLAFERAQLEQVALNLFENACKFTPKAGRIEVKGYPVFWERRSDTFATGMEAERRRRINPEPNAYRVDISNSGPGIPPERLDRIFEEYATYSAGEACAGSGLGLAICKLIVQQHDGRIWAENHEGGPTLSFVLPFESGAALKEQAARAFQSKGTSS